MPVTTCSATTRNAAITSKNSSINSKGISQPVSQPIDLPLLFLTLGLLAFGLLMVYSSSFIFAQERSGDGYALIKKQLVFAALGIATLWGASRVSYEKWRKWAYPMIATATLLLALVMIPGVGARVGGAQRWIRLGGFNFQPGEFAKFALIFFVCFQLEKKRDRLHKLAAGVLANFVVPLPALLLLLLQPDFGTTVMITLVILFLMYLAGVPKKYLVTAVICAAVVGAWLALGTPYRRNRVMTFIDPWRDPGGKGFQILQSLLGLHLGGLTGVGLGNGKEKLFYLPEAHNDFIFAVIGEELGFLGILGVVMAYLFFIHRGLKIAWGVMESRRDFFGMLLASGITLALGLQGLVNMSVVLGLVPTKGLTLPFISYGGSALLIDLFAVGVLLSISRGSLGPRVARGREIL